MSYINVHVPWGVRLLQKTTEKCCPRLHFNREVCYKTSVILLTYFAYMCYHLSRKPISVVKAVLHRNCSKLTPPNDVDPVDNTWCDYAPFNQSDATQLLGELDSSFLFCYAIAMFVSGMIAERMNLRYFLSFGMLSSAIFCYAFGVAKVYDIHSYGYFVIMQGLAGIAQTTGWPGVVTVMSNWFGEKKRGLIFGLWNSHTSLGNILGSLIAAEYVETDWSLSFIVPGLIIGIGGFILFLFLVVHPHDVGIPQSSSSSTTNNDIKNVRSRKLENRVANRGIINESSGDECDDDIVVRTIDDNQDDRGELLSDDGYVINHRAGLVGDIQRRFNERSHLLTNTSTISTNSSDDGVAIGFFGACRIPGVVEFSLSLFFSKLVSYTFLYWLPSLINASTTMGATLSADISTLFDVGGILGAIIAGAVSDQTGMSAITCVGMLALAAPMMFVYQSLSSVSLSLNMFLLVLVGLLVNGPYALITTAVSAELGTHHSLHGNSKALATVTAIIDGTGSIGAAVGPLLAGFVSQYGWNSVFQMLIISDIIALILLLRLARQELKRFRHTRELRIE